MTMREGSGEEKLYLDVPFPDKEQVKALGARWDRDDQALRLLSKVGVRVEKCLADVPGDVRGDLVPLARVRI